MDTTDERLIEKTFKKCHSLVKRKNLGVFSKEVREKAQDEYSLYKDFLKLTFDDFLRKIQEKILAQSDKKRSIASHQYYD